MYTYKCKTYMLFHIIAIKIAHVRRFATRHISAVLCCLRGLFVAHMKEFAHTIESRHTYA